MCVGETFQIQHQGIKIIVKLNEICLNNVVTQYGAQFYTQKTVL